MAKSWYSIRNAAKGDAEISIYDEIGVYGVRAKDFVRDLKAAGDVQSITLRINSPGGSVFDGLAIHNVLKDHKARVTVKVDGIAASIASVIAMAGDRVEMPANAMMMIHDPSGAVLGTSSDMREIADVMDKVKASLITAYTAKSGQDADTIGQMMAETTWLSAEEAVEWGFADEVTGAVAIAACADTDTLTSLDAPEAVLSAFARQPAASSITVNTEDFMSEKDKQPAGKTDAGTTDLMAAERERCAAIAKMCAEAGSPTLADGFIAAGLTAEDVKAKLDAAGEIKTICAQAKVLNPSLDTDAMAKEFLAKGTSPDAVRAALWAKAVEASEATVIVNTLTPEAAAGKGAQAGSGANWGDVVAGMKK